MVFPERVILFLLVILGITFGMRLLPSLKRVALAAMLTLL